MPTLKIHYLAQGPYEVPQNPAHYLTNCVQIVEIGDGLFVRRDVDPTLFMAAPTLLGFLVDELRPYLTDRADAECDASSAGYTGNEEMTLLVSLDNALRAAGVTP